MYIQVEGEDEGWLFRRYNGLSEAYQLNEISRMSHQPLAKLMYWFRSKLNVFSRSKSYY